MSQSATHTGSPRRVTTVKEVKDRFRSGFKPEVFAPALAMKPRPSDVFIATYPKSGTTWVQQIVHGLRSRGSMDFEEISQVVPYIEVAPSMKMDLDAPQVAEPRAFKTHLPWELVPKGARYIYVLRDPKDVAISTYHYFNDWMLERDAVDAGTFAFEFCMAQDNPSGRYWEHVRSWLTQRGGTHVLFVCFEDLKRDLVSQVARIAAFLGISADQALLDLVTSQATFAFMKAHEHKFDEHLLMPAIDKSFHLPPGRVPAKVRTGQIGSHKHELSQAAAAAMDRIWQEIIAEPLGIASYEELRAELAAS